MIARVIQYDDDAIAVYWRCLDRDCRNCRFPIEQVERMRFTQFMLRFSKELYVQFYDFQSTKVQAQEIFTNLHKWK